MDHSSSVPGGKATVWYAVVRRFRDFLASRGRDGWALACLQSMHAVSYRTIDAFFRDTRPGFELTGLDPESGSAFPPVFSFRDRERDLVPELAVWLAPDFAVVHFQLFDDGYMGNWSVAAAPRESLEGSVRDMDDHRLAAMRDSDEFQVLGKHRIVIDRTPTWDDVVLPERTRAEIRRNIDAFLLGREAHARMRIPWKRGLLFVGPPGNGKTTLCRVIAAQSGLPCLYMLLTSDGQADPLGRMFARARQLAPCVLIFEDLDSLFGREGDLSYFLNQMDGFTPNDGLLVIATTNHPEDIDPALLNRPSRFDRVWTIGNPDAAGRAEYLRRIFGTALPDADLARLAKATDGFSVTYLRELFVSASQEALLAGCEVTASHADGALSRLRQQLDGAGRRHVEWIPLGFRREEEDESARRP